MGTCLSKKKTSSCFNSSTAPSVSIETPSKPLDPIKFFNNNALKPDVPEVTDPKISNKIVHEQNLKQDCIVEEEDTSPVNKEIVIKHRKSHDRDRRQFPADGDGFAAPVCASTSTSTSNQTNNNTNAEIGSNGGNIVVVRTSSCTKEEVDAILIQCGRLSRNNSSGAPASGRKYSGSKRSYDFDCQDEDLEYSVKSKGSANDDNQDTVAETRQHRQRHRQSPRPSSSSQGRKRTPSRERDGQRSGSRERGSGGGGGGGSNSSGRRVSRSPGRRSETSNTTSTTNPNSHITNRPAKMVSVPASTTSSLVIDKSSNGESTGATKRVSVKRNVNGEAAVVVGSGSRTAASPRSQSPARTNKGGSNENTNQQPSLSRSSSRKAEKSPYRRNPLSEIDSNNYVVNGNKAACISSRGQQRNKEMEAQQTPMKKTNAETNCGVIAQGTNYKGPLDNKLAKAQQQVMEEANGQPPMTTTMVEASGADSMKLQTITRTRSARRSRDLDFNPETSFNSTHPSYTSLLLEDIHNFHQKNNNNNNENHSFTLPPCVTKACSIVEAVADLNSTTSSNLSCVFSEDRRSPPLVGANTNLVGTKFVESEVVANDDLMEPSFHKYVTVRRGGTLCGEDMDGQESSGSNSFVGGGSHQQWGFSSSSWEPNSADSTDRWTSKSKTSPHGTGIQRHELSEPGNGLEESARRGFSGQRSNVIGHGRVGIGKTLETTPVVAATASM